MQATWRPRQTVLAECPCRFCVARRLSRGPPAFKVFVEATELGSRLRGSGDFCFFHQLSLKLLIFFLFHVQPFQTILFPQLTAFENSRVAAPTFWKRVGGFHENCLRLARYLLLEIQTVSASRVVFVARSFFEMLGTPKGRCVCQLRGSPFFAYFLWHRYESELSPGNPRLGRESSSRKPQTAQIASLSAPYDSRYAEEQTPESASTSKQKNVKTPANIRPSLLKTSK
jgi:hypothetical protein